VKLTATLATVAGQLGLALLSLQLAVPAAAYPATSPASQPGQWIVVGVPAPNATTGTLTAFQRVGQQWKVVLGPTPATVGELGVGAPADGVHRTPVGTFTFDQAFGRQPNPGTKMPYFKTTDQDWWDEDAGSPTYNAHVRGSRSPSSIAENLYESGPVYDYAVNIAVNPQRIPGRVAGIFLHVTDGNPTWGCVAIGRDEMRSVLNWLDPSASPQITIGVGPRRWPHPGPDLPTPLIAGNSTPSWRSNPSSTPDKKWRRGPGWWGYEQAAQCRRWQDYLHQYQRRRCCDE